MAAVAESSERGKASVGAGAETSGSREGGAREDELAELPAPAEAADVGAELLAAAPILAARALLRLLPRLLGPEVWRALAAGSAIRLKFSG